MLEERVVSEEDLQGDRGPRLLRYLVERGADEFSITVMALHDTQSPFVDRFEDELGPYERPPAVRPVVTASDGLNAAHTVRLWTLDDASLELLLSFVDSSVFHWPAGPDGWFEDLTIYRRGELVLGLLSDERAGLLRLTVEEHGVAARLV